MSQQLCDDLRQIRPDILDLDLVEGAIANGKGLQTPADWIPEPGDMERVQKGATVGIPELRTDREEQDDAVLDKEGQLAENCFAAGKSHGYVHLRLGHNIENGIEYPSSLGIPEKNKKGKWTNPKKRRTTRRAGAVISHWRGLKLAKFGSQVDNGGNKQELGKMGALTVTNKDKRADDKEVEPVFEKSDRMQAIEDAMTDEDDVEFESLLKVRVRGRKKCIFSFFAN